MFYLREKNEKKFKARIELYDEKTKEAIRLINFNKPKDFENFLEDYPIQFYCLKSHFEIHKIC